MITSSNNPRSDEQFKELRSLALRGMRLLSSWTAQVMELVITMILYLQTLTKDSAKLKLVLIVNKKNRGEGINVIRERALDSPNSDWDLI